MENVSVKIQALYEKMGASEKKVAEFIMNNPKAVIPFSISELAENSGSSEATIVRFSQKLGFSGYQELKIAIASQGDYKQEKEDINITDSPKTVYDKVCDDIYSSLEKTKQVLNDKTMESVCDAILSAKRILIFGLGSSASVAADMAHKLLRLGLDAVSYSDNHMQAIAAAHVDGNCLLVAFSHSGSSKDIIDALKIAKSNNCTTISITNKSKSPIYKHSDFVINTNANESNFNLLGLSSRIAQLAIVDTIYYYTACHISESASKIQSTLNALSTKKF